ncbi:glycosyltransferase family 32 protein [Deinococcus caeni]
MIPKKLHYVWFGGNPKSDLIKRCISSWQEHMPDYEIIEWNEDNFDITKNSYAQQAFSSKKWAFVSDFVRLKVLHEHGGIYLDSDVEVFRSFDDLLDQGAFTGFEKYMDTYSPITAVVGAVPHHPWISELLSHYEGIDFEDGFTNTARISENLNKKYKILNNNKLQSFMDVTIYPAEYFCIPSEDGYAVHHFNGSWLGKTSKVRKFLRKFLIRK